MLNDVLIVDDEADIRQQIEGILSDEGFEARSAGSSKQAIDLIRERLPGLVLLDIWLQNSEMQGLELLSVIKRDHPDLPVVMISGHGTIETAFNAHKRGAYDYIEKPFKTERLLLVVNRALEADRLRRENAELRLRGAAEHDLIGQTPAVQQLRQQIERVAPTNSRILITGPAGCGKEVVARCIHTRSRRAGGPFIVANCAMMTPDKMEVELFGTEPGYITGQPRKIGMFEQAHRGTLLLDEVADMPLETQGKIVRLLQEQKFTRVGGSTPIQVDVRVMAASNRDLKAEISAGRLREDLYYRLKVVPIEVPSLQSRREDIARMLQYFMQRASQASGLPVRPVMQDAVAALQAYSWPGNVRQLRNIAEWLLIMPPGGPREPITTEMLPPDIYNEAPAVLRNGKADELMSLPLREARETFEREYLLAQVTRFGGNISRTANFVGMERSALHRKLKSLGVHQGTDRSERDDSERMEQKVSVPG
jgi:two-component system nitrogen regulation response regulator NtrX